MLNIEDGLCAYNDDEMFLMASMAFLQEHAKRKLGLTTDDDTDTTKDTKKTKRTYSNLLLFENTNGEQRERYFIELKNSDRFSDVIQSETNIPNGALSDDQMLPKAKNQKKSKLRHLFRSRNKNNKKTKKEQLQVIQQQQQTQEDKEVKEPGAIMVQEETVPVKIDWNLELQKKCRRHSVDPEYLKRLLPPSGVGGVAPPALKESVHRNLRARRTDSMSTVEKYLLEMEEAAEAEYRCSSTRKHQHQHQHQEQVVEERREVRRQQSKLSVCIEDETDSDMDKQEITYSNIPDELKANLPPEVLQKVLNEMIVYLEKAPSNR